MTVRLPLDKMTVREKLRVMEEIWEDLSRNPDDIKSPDWHKHALEEREARIASGQAKFIDWEKAKRTFVDAFAKARNESSPPR